MSLRSRFVLNERRQLQFTAVLEVALAVILVYGLVRRDPGIIVNAGVSLAVTQLVPVLERDLRIQMDPGLVLWITSAVFLHALGTVSVVVDGQTLSLYRSTEFWDHITHALSASVVAAAGYVTARAYDLHDDRLHLPPKFMFVFILLVTLAFGVLWEVIEFTLGELGPVVGFSPLTQYGLEDTLMDLVFDSVGAVVVATWGTAHLAGVVDAVRDRLGAT